MLGRDLSTVALPAKEQDLKYNLLPLNTAGQGDWKGAQQKGLVSPSPAWLASWGLHKMESPGCVYCQGSGLGIRWARVEHLRLFIAR